MTYYATWTFYNWAIQISVKEKQTYVKDKRFQRADKCNSLPNALGIIWGKRKQPHATNQERERPCDQSLLSKSAERSFGALQISLDCKFNFLAFLF